MAFDPTVPAVNADLDANPIRDNFNALKALIDAIPTSPPTLKSGDGNLVGSGILDISGATDAGLRCAGFRFEEMHRGSRAESAVE